MCSRVIGRFDRAWGKVKSSTTHEALGPRTILPRDAYQQVPFLPFANRELDQQCSSPRPWPAQCDQKLSARSAMISCDRLVYYPATLVGHSPRLRDRFRLISTPTPTAPTTYPIIGRQSSSTSGSGARRKGNERR